MADVIDFLISLKDKLSGPAKTVSRSIKGLISDAENFQAVEEAVGDAVKSGLSTLATAGVAAGAALAGAGIAAGVAFAAVSEDVDRITRAFSFMAGSSKDGRAEFELLKNIAKDTAAPFDEIAGIMRELKQVGFTSEQSAILSEIALNVDAITGDGKKFVDVFKDMSKEGGLSQSKFQDLAEQMGGTVRLSEALSSELGISTDELSKMLSESSQGVKDFGAVQRAVMKLGAGLDGAAKNSKSLFERLKSAAVLKLADGADFINLRPISDAFEAFLDSGPFATLIKGIREAVLGVVRMLIANGPKIDEFGALVMNAFSMIVPAAIQFAGVLIELAVQALPTITKIGNAILEAFGSNTEERTATITSILGVLKTVLIGVAGVIGGVVAAFFTIAAPFLLAVTAIGAFIAAIAYAVGWVVGNFGKVAAVVTETFISILPFLGNLPTLFLDIGAKIVLGLIEGILGGVSGVVSAIVDVAGSMKNALMSALGIASPSKVFEELGGFTAEGMAVGIESETPMVQAAASSMVNPDGLAVAMSSGNKSSGGMMGGITIENINVVAPDDADPATFGSELAAAIKRELGIVFEDMATEAA